jgi:FtsH-binding integral membrane protein
MMGLFGLIGAGVVNLFVRSSGLQWFTSIVGVIVFAGLTAYDMQKLRALRMALSAGDEEGEGRLAVHGALALYLDFINIFLYLLRLFGRRR